MTRHTAWRRAARAGGLVLTIGAFTAPTLAPTPAAAWWHRGGWGGHPWGWHAGWRWHEGWGYRHCCWGPPVFVRRPVVVVPPPVVYAPAPVYVP